VIISANVGDSRGVMARQHGETWEAIGLSNDHKPEIPGERDRIEANGGMVEAYIDQTGTPLGPYRVWVRGSNPPVPGLAMSRSIGDAEAESVGVISSPEMLDFRMTIDDRFILLASDGIWEFITNEQAVKMTSLYW
jgi:serine/threonine protein phosphatase PrpC